MECERFIKLLKQWYVQVQDEALAPARMVMFMEKHLAECPICMMDPEARSDMEKIIKLALPQEKLKVATRTKKSETDEDLDEDESEEVESDDEDDTDDDDDDTDDDDDLEDDDLDEDDDDDEDDL